tara:strand:+ start:9001 stop:9411 length:411 start_codon:yes stop_codon:yes gene_type:complete
MLHELKSTQTLEPRTTPRKHFIRTYTSPVAAATLIPTRAKFEQVPEKEEVVLSKFEQVVLEELTVNIGVISTMGDGSLPFLIGLLASKFKLVFTNENGLIRGRFLKATILHLQELNLLKVQHTSKFPLGPGRVSLV